jgi:uncharacterized protein (TIGR03435 family)
MKATAFFLALAVSGIAADTAAFEVASIKVNGSVGQPGFLKPTPDGLMIENMPIRNCIGWAWNLPLYRISEAASGSARYDIVAKAAAATPVDRIRLMLRTLLEERFHLVVHFETKDVPVYALVSKGGLKQLHDPDPGHAAGVELASTDAGGGKHWMFHNTTLSALAGLFSAAPLGRPILDLTGLKGSFDYSFVEPPRTLVDGPLLEHILGDVFPEIQRQLGIRVEARAAPSEILIIDRVDKTPTEN